MRRPCDVIFGVCILMSVCVCELTKMGRKKWKNVFFGLRNADMRRAQNNKIPFKSMWCQDDVILARIFLTSLWRLKWRLNDVIKRDTFLFLTCHAFIKTGSLFQKQHFFPRHHLCKWSPPRDYPLFFQFFFIFFLFFFHFFSKLARGWLPVGSCPWIVACFDTPLLKPN